MNFKRFKYLILTVSIFFVLGLITILSSNNKVQDQGKLVVEEGNNDLLKDNYKSNLIVESDDNNTVNTEEKEDGSIRVLPENGSEDIIALPNPNIDGEVILKKL